jgi:hypothetical protein
MESVGFADKSARNVTEAGTPVLHTRLTNGVTAFFVVLSLGNRLCTWRVPCYHGRVQSFGNFKRVAAGVPGGDVARAVR